MDKAELKRKIKRFLCDAFINGNMDYEGITDKIMEWINEVK